MDRTPFKKMQIEAENDVMGLSFHSGRAYWSMPGYGKMRWAPYWLRDSICAAWNHVACVFIGHDHLCRSAPGELPVCCSCCRRVKPTPEQELSVSNEW